ncbi:hypothetical protein [Henriciella pelagia]|uniref:Uncharacterized protein n=1 Tax=Henriciella pelagia TaxID=1977912 RepID=A0ABQ1JUY5_9PROT|nr:hypothetical protein [Henriciella pelagia]GGB78813.1 hypothetical protein GCM10011503_29570 [Henriciella pelagia]
MEQQLKARTELQSIAVDLYKSSTNRKLSSVEMTAVPRKGEIVWIESRRVAMMVEDVIWNAENNSVQVYLAPDRNRLDRSD